MKDEHDARIYLHKRFKRLINYKNREGKVVPVRNEQFSQTLGSNFYERQKIAHQKILRRDQNMNNRESPRPMNNSDLNNSILINSNQDSMQLTSNFLSNFLNNSSLHQTYQPMYQTELSELQKKVKKYKASQERVKLQGQNVLNQTILHIIKILEILLSKIELEQIESEIVLKYASDLKYKLLQLIQNLQNREFYEVAILIQQLQFDKIQVQSESFSFENLEQDIHLVGQAYKFQQTKQDESYQNVLIRKVESIFVKYDELLQSEIQMKELELLIPDEDALIHSRYFKKKKRSLIQQTKIGKFECNSGLPLIGHDGQPIQKGIQNCCRIKLRSTLQALIIKIIQHSKVL
eukprot:403363134